MAEAKINAVIKRRALEQSTYDELKEAYIAEVVSNPFLPDEVKDIAADAVDHHLTSMSHELQRLELTVGRINLASKEDLMAEIATNGKAKAKKKAPTRKKAASA